MIDLDELERRLENVQHAYGLTGEGAGVQRAIEVVREMRAEALVDPSANAMPVMHASPTTQAMRAAAFPRSGSLRATMVQLLLNHGHTDDQLEVALERPHQTVSAARHGLVQSGWVQAMTKGGEPVLRPTRAGNPAQVWTLTPAARLRMSIEQQRG